MQNCIYYAYLFLVQNTHHEKHSEETGNEILYYQLFNKSNGSHIYSHNFLPYVICTLLIFLGGSLIKSSLTYFVLPVLASLHRRVQPMVVSVHSSTFISVSAVRTIYA